MLDIPAGWKVALRVPEIHVYTCTCIIKLPWHAPHTRQAKAQILSSFICLVLLQNSCVCSSLSSVFCKVLCKRELLSYWELLCPDLKSKGLCQNWIEGCSCYKRLLMFPPVVSHQLYCTRISCESGSISIFELQQAINNKPINIMTHFKQLLIC